MKLNRNIFLKEFYKLFNGGFRFLITWKTKINQSLFYLKDKTIINHAVSVKEIVLVVYVALVKPSVMQKLDESNIIIQLKVQNHRKPFETISTTVLH